MTKAFADGMPSYAQAGWPCVIPVPAETKSPPPNGYTGADGADTDPLTLVQWASTHADYSIALRMPDGVVGIDVDHYTKGDVNKRGNDDLQALVEKLGPLPPTWCSTARGSDDGPGPSRIMFYRVPEGRYRTKLSSAIEVIQRHHRYAVVWPSTHQTGGVYRWYGPDGKPTEDVPKPDELPELPEAWVEHLRDGATEAGPAAADVASGQALLAELEADDRDPCAEMYAAIERAAADLAKCDQGSRHDTMTERVHRIIFCGAHGHPGAGRPIAKLRELWEQLTAGEDRSGEFERMLLTSARKAVTEVGSSQVKADPCLLVGSIPVAAPAPSNDADSREDPEPIAPTVSWSIRQVIGAEPFDPEANLDQTLAAAVIERMYPAIRYAVDADTWLVRGPYVWEARGDMSAWAVSQVAWLMPRGDKDAPQDTPEHNRHLRRKRFMTSGGAGAIASKIRALVAEESIVSVRLADLDADREILWAGGMPYDLRASLEGPALAAHIDPSTPHLHSAAVTPENRPTPLWDAFLEAVWPDPKVRAWALRVLSIAVTGYADRALPILVGETGRGKTQVVSLIMSVLGTYAHTADPRLLSSGDSAHASIIYALKGRRLSFIDEGPREGKVAAERLKQITGGGDLTGNRMRENPITFSPTHTLVLTANDEPTLSDPAIRSRVRLIPCDGDPARVRSARAAIGDTSSPQWRREAPGVLAMLMREAAAWLRDPSSALTESAPESIRYIAEEIAAEQDPIRRWQAEETVPDEIGTKARDLYRHFVQWCRDSNMHPRMIPSETKWGRELTRLGFPSKHRRDGKYRLLQIRPGSGGTGQIPTVGGFMAGAPGSPEGCGGFGPSGGGLVAGSNHSPSQNKIAGQTAFSNSGVYGVTGSLTLQKHQNKNKDQHIEDTQRHSHGGESENSPNLTSTLTKTGSDLRKDPGDGFEPRPATPKDRPKRTRTALKAEAKAKARVEKILAASGEVLPLPVVTNRSGAINPVTLDEAGKVLEAIIAKDGELTVDVEHTGYPVGHSDYALRTIQLGNDELAVDLDASDPEQADLARRMLAAAPRLRAHSATADLVPLDHAGLIDPESAWDRMHDTVIPAKLADPHSTGNDSDLKGLAANVLGDRAVSPAAEEARKALFQAGRWLTDIEADTPVERSGWAQVDPRCTTMIRYASSDVLDASAVGKTLPAPPAAIYERERRVQKMTARVAHRGVRLDGYRVKELLYDHTRARTQVAEQIRDEYGIENPGSAQQVAAKLTELGANLPRTKPSKRHPEGQPSAAKGAIDMFKRDEGPIGDLVRKVLEYRHHNTLLGLILEPYWHLVEHGDGRARPTIYTLGADTGRMSCVRPNLQQVPRQGGVRACITADPGYLMVGADFSSVEIRVAAALSGDENLQRMIREGVDLHSEAARIVFGPNFTKADRYDVKRGNFGWLYGGSLETIARQMGAPIDRAQALIDTLRQMAPQLVEWTEQVKRAVRSGATQFPTYSGRVIHLPREYPHKAPNYAIQGTARELLVDGLLRWERTPWGKSTLLPVHDEIDVFVPEDEAEDASKALVAAMETTLFGVEIVADPSEPTFAWADAA